MLHNLRKLGLFVQVTFARNFQMYHRLNNFQNFEFCTEARFYTSVCNGGHILRSLNSVSKLKTATALDFVVCPCAKFRATIVNDVIKRLNSDEPRSRDVGYIWKKTIV